MKNKKIDWTVLIGFLIIPQLAGVIGSLLGPSKLFENSDFIKPDIKPPGVVFAIVWPVLFLLMGIAAYIAWQTHSEAGNSGLKWFWAQLVANTLWSLFFFRYSWFLFSFFWLILIFVLAAVATFKFFKAAKAAGWLMVPYLGWLCFAAVLNLMVFILNR